MNSNTFLIIGASGYLGSYFLKNICDLYTDQKIIATYNEQPPSILHDHIKWLKVDVQSTEDINKLFLELENSNTKFDVIYLSSFHHPDRVEENPILAYKINIDALAYILRNMPNIASFYYSSTDSVYGESLNNYHFKENDAHNPVNEYGRQKSAAERLVLNSGHNVIHYPFLIGPSLTNKPHFFDQIVNDLHAKKKLDAFVDSCRNSIDFNQAAILTLRLITKRLNIGTINISADEDLSKYDIFLKIAEKFNYNKNLVIPISIKTTNHIFIAKRPTSTLMNNDKIKSILSDLSEIKLII